MTRLNGSVLDRLRAPVPMEKASIGSERQVTERENLFRYWKDEIRRARSKLDRESKEDEWLRYRQIQTYQGDFSKYNFIAPPINDRVQEITGERPDVMIDVTHESQRELISQLEAMNSHAMSRTGYWPTVKQIIFDSAWLGIGWGKQEWVVDGLPSTPGVQDLNAAQERAELAKITGEELAIKVYLQSMTVHPDDVDWLHIERHRQALHSVGSLEERLALQSHIEQHEARVNGVAKSRSDLFAVRPEDMIFDPDARRWADVMWSAEHTVEILEDVLANSDYRNASRPGDFSVTHERLDADPENDEVNDVTLRAIDGEVDDSPGIRTVHVYRIHDRRGGPVWNVPGYEGPRLIIYSPQQSNQLPLNVLPWPYRHSIHEPLTLNVAADAIEGVPMPRMIEHAHRQLAFINDARVKTVRKMPKDRAIIPKKWFKTNAERNAFLDGQVDIIFSEGPVSQQEYVQVKPHPVNPDLFQVENVMQGYINRSLRSAEVSQGIEGGAKFATEIEALMAARGRGVREYQEITSTWLAKTRRIFFWQNHDLSNTELIVSATGGVSLDRNVLQPEEIPLDLRVTLDVDSFSAANRELNKKQLREFLSFLFVESGGIFLPMLTPEGMTNILVKALRLNGFKEPEKFVTALDAQTQSVMIQQIAAGGAPQSPGPNAAGPPPLSQPTTQFSGQMAADARAV